MAELKTLELRLLTANLECPPHPNGRHRHDRVEGSLTGPHLGRIREVAAAELKVLRLSLIMA